MELATAFPFGLKDSSHKKPLFLPFIPTQERALQLFDIYYEYCSWMWVFLYSMIIIPYLIFTQVQSHRSAVVHQNVYGSYLWHNRHSKRQHHPLP